MLDLKQIPVPNPKVIHQVVGDEMVLVLPERGKVNVLNEAGARIWSLCDGFRSAGEIAEIVTQEYEIGSELAESDTLVFLNELADREIILVGSEDGV